ncbi:Crp/Fnr family transcriptional regulator [Sphingobacterium sp. HJSM2_6]|uniref:Crp/Fnr family transcriptional regulator n=1 Tax=Sphingobacterium sp. HJSM2_6 TaxID=3366264 RepID=UPI003BEC3C75
MEFSEIALNIYPLSADALELLESIVQQINVPKNHILIEAGKAAPFIYFQMEGISRIYYHKEHKEVILGFTFPSDVLISLKNYSIQEKGYESIQTLEPSILYQIPIKALQLLYDQSLEIANWGRKLAEIEALKIESRLMLRLFNSSNERYLELLKKAPDLTNRIKLGYIASYLGISQVTLSRIRGIK